MADDKASTPKEKSAEKKEKKPEKSGCLRIAEWLLILFLLAGIFWGISIDRATNSPRYTVQHGDYPIKIARTTGVKLELLYQLNPGLESKTIYTGDIIILPKDSMWREYSNDSGIMYRGFLIAEKSCTTASGIDLTIPGGTEYYLNAYDEQTRKLICSFVSTFCSCFSDSSGIVNESTRAIRVFSSGYKLVALYPE